MLNVRHPHESHEGVFLTKIWVQFVFSNDYTQGS